jgi:hypothetical protein
VSAHDDFARGGFDPATVPRVLEDLRRYFPATFPIAATVRIDFVIVDAAATPRFRISFSVRGVEFSIGAAPDSGMECDQEIIVPESIWLECDGGRLLRRDLFALCVNRQLKPFKPAVAGLRYFISYYFDLGDISPWIRVSEQERSADNLVQMRRMRAELAPQFPAHDLLDEYALAEAPYDDRVA